LSHPHQQYGHVQHPASPLFEGFTPVAFPGDADDEHSIDYLQRKCVEYLPQRGIYSSEIRSRPHLSEYRCNAARWMIKVQF
jgi:hypothetical protein